MNKLGRKSLPLGGRATGCSIGVFAFDKEVARGGYWGNAEPPPLSLVSHTAC